MKEYTNIIMNIKTYDHQDEYSPNGKLIETIRNELGPYIPQHKEFGLILTSIHYDEEINFNCDAREILYAINACYSKHGNFRENVYGKALSIPVCYAKNHMDFSKLELYFRYYFKQRIELLDSWALKISLDINMLLKKKEEVFSNYEIVFYFKNIPFELKQYIRSYLVCTYESLTKLRILYDNINNI